MADARLHIGIDARELVGQPTGVGRYLHHVLRTWTADPAFPHRLTAFLAADPLDTLRAALPGIVWVTAPSPKAGTVWEQSRLPGAIRRADIDVLFAAGYTAPIRLSVPFVVAIYDVSFAAHPEWFRPREGFRRRWLTRSAARRAHSIVTISEFSAGEIVRWLGVGRARIHVAPPGAPAVDQAAFGTSREPIVLFAGSLFNRRHIPDLLGGFALARARVPAARLVLVGDNRTSPPIDPLGVAQDLGLAGSVEWHRYVDDAELHRLYSRARVFAFLSDYEGFAMTPLEALACGTPPVLLDTAVAREVYGAGARLVGAAPEAIADALESLLTDDRAHADARAAGLAVLARYSWPDTAATILRALEEAAPRP